MSNIRFVCRRFEKKKLFGKSFEVFELLKLRKNFEILLYTNEGFGGISDLPGTVQTI